MATFTDEQNSVNSIIDDYGTTVTLATQATETYSEDTGWSEGYNTGTSIEAVPYNYFTGRVNYQEYGNLDLGDVNIVIKGDVTVAEKDKVTYLGTDYFVSAVNPLPLGDTELAQILALNEKL